MSRKFVTSFSRAMRRSRYVSASFVACARACLVSSAAVSWLCSYIWTMHFENALEFDICLKDYQRLVFFKASLEKKGPITRILNFLILTIDFIDYSYFQFNDQTSSMTANDSCNAIILACASRSRCWDCNVFSSKSLYFS